MNTTKAGRLLATFSQKEWASFSEYLLSPLLNKHQELIPLAQWMSLQSLQWPAEKAWNAAYPHTPWDNKRFNYLMAWLLDAATRFLTWQHWAQHPSAARITTARLLSERGLDKHYEFETERLRREIQNHSIKDAAWWLTSFELNEVERQHFSRQETRRSNPFLQKGADFLDRYYFTQKLKYACAMMSEQGIVASDAEYLFVEETAEFIAKNAELYLNEPSIAVYYHIWRMLTSESDSETEFRRLRSLIQTRLDHFTREDGRNLYEYALNYCIRQIRHLREPYVGEALQLYETGIDTGILLIDEKLSPWHYKNVVKLGLRSGRYEWTEQFIRQKNGLLEASFRDDALHFNLADLYFFTKNFDSALEHLHQVEFSDIHYNLGAKEMLAKIYCETGAEDALFSLLNAFKIYLRRNKIIGEQVQRPYLNFIRLLEKVMKCRPKERALLRGQIEQTESVVAKSWLLELLH